MYVIKTNLCHFSMLVVLLRLLVVLDFELLKEVLPPCIVDANEQRSQSMVWVLNANAGK